MSNTEDDHKEIDEAISQVRNTTGYGSVEVIIRSGNITQITVKNIKQVMVPQKEASL